jgi:hypothetical protein
MSSVAIKITSSIADAARAAAKLADRSLTAQIEHWARLGMDADEKLTGSAMMAMKRGDWESSAKPQDLAEIQSYLAQLSAPGEATKLALASGFLDGKTTYSLEDGSMVRTNPDGSETRGRMDGKEFIPFSEDS